MDAARNPATIKQLSIPKVIGHRGAAARAPENTLAGFRRAAALGCRWVEFDVRLSADDQPIVFHDDTLERTTDGVGVVAAMPLAELARRDAGTHFSTDYRGEPIPTLDQTLALLIELGLGCDLEMKTDIGRETALAEIIARTLARAGTERLPPMLIESFSAPALAAFARHLPAIGRALALEKLGSDWRVLAAGLGIVSMVCNHETLDRQEVDAMRDVGLHIQTYTVNDPRRALDLLSWGVDSVISDAPDTILAALSG